MGVSSRGPCPGADACALALALVAGLACSDAPPRPPPGERPSVVLIVVDTLRADRVGAYGAPRDTTPNIDRLAAESTRYERAVSQAPWTTPSIGSLLSSRHPAELGVRRVEHRLDESLVLLPEVLRDAGWTTGAVVSHSFCGARWGFDQGFDVFDESHVTWAFGITAPGVTDAALAFVESVAAGAREEPFFLFVHYFDPHFSYMEHPDHAFPAEDGYDGPIRPPVSLLPLRKPGVRLDARDAREMLRIYDSEVAFTDHHVGRLLDGLRGGGWLDRTLLVLTADHGEEFLDHGGIEHTRTLFDELLRVPLLIRYPGARPSVEDAPVALLDVYPTVLDYLGIEPPVPLAGRSLLSGPDEERAVFSETRRQANLRSIVRGHHKLVLDVATGRSALFDLRADPGERRDVSASQPELARALRKELAAWSVEQDRRLRAAREVELPEEERERLRALGYAE